MTNWIISSSILILVIICLRGLFKGKIRLRFQYALWLLVAVRLLIPVNIGSSAISIENITNKLTLHKELETQVSSQTEKSANSYDYKDYTNAVKIYEGVKPQTQNSQQHESEDVSSEANSSDRIKPVQLLQIFQDILFYVWIIGIFLISFVFVASNLYFNRNLRTTRQRMEVTYTKLPVYVSHKVETPCVFGIFRPCIYVTESVAEDETILRHSVYHEISHFKQGDLLWAILRCVCLALHWYNPLVWWAAKLSRQDAELACDEATISKLGEEERLAYGKTLIQLTCEKRQDLFLTATTMTSEKKSITERIKLIAKKPKFTVYALVIILLTTVVAVGCTFTNAKKETELPETQKEHNIEDQYSFAVNVSETRELTIVLNSPEPEENYFSVDQILVYDGSKQIQTIDTTTIVPPEDYAWDGLYVNLGSDVGEPDVRDINFDGAEDFGLLAVESYPKNIPYGYFIWNQESNLFEYKFALFGMDALEVNTELKQLRESSHDTYGESISIYCYSENGELIKEPQFFDEPQRDKICLAVMPDGVSQAGGDYRYLIPEAQEFWKDSYEKMKAHASGDGSWLDNERSCGIWIVYNDEWTCLTDQGFIVDFSKRVYLEDADAISFYHLCLSHAMTNDTGTPIRPEEITRLTSASLVYNDKTYTITDSDILNEFEENFSVSQEIRGGAACPFTAPLIFRDELNKTLTIFLATDSCNVWLSDGVYYEYQGYEDIEEIYELFMAESTYMDKYILKVNDTLYYGTDEIGPMGDSGYVAGKIESSVSETETPEKNGESNFGCIGNSYTYDTDGSIMVFMEDEEWHWFHRLQEETKSFSYLSDPLPGIPCSNPQKLAGIWQMQLYK